MNRRLSSLFGKVRQGVRRHQRGLARIRIRIRRTLSLPTVLALVATACLAVFANRLIADGAYLVVGVLSLLAALGSAGRRAR